MIHYFKLAINLFASYVIILYYLSFGLFVIFLVVAFMPPGEGGIASSAQWIMGGLECLLVILFEILLLIWLLKKIINFLNRRTYVELVFMAALFIALFIIYIYWQDRGGAYFGAKNLLNSLIITIRDISHKTY